MPVEVCISVAEFGVTETVVTLAVELGATETVVTLAVVTVELAVSVVSVDFEVTGFAVGVAA